MGGEAISGWSSETAMAALCKEMGKWIASAADPSALKTALAATLKGHVADFQLEKTVMPELTFELSAQLDELQTALAEASTRLAALSWAFNAACSEAVGFSADETAAKLAKIRDAVSVSRAKYLERYAAKASRPAQTSVDRLILELAHIFHEHSVAPLIERRSNGQLMLHPLFVLLLEKSWAALPNALGIRPSRAAAFVSRAKRSSKDLRLKAATHQPLYYSAVKN